MPPSSSLWLQHESKGGLSRQERQRRDSESYNCVSAFSGPDLDRAIIPYACTCATVLQEGAQCSDTLLMCGDMGIRGHLLPQSRIHHPWRKAGR